MKTILTNHLTSIITLYLCSITPLYAMDDAYFALAGILPNSYQEYAEQSTLKNSPVVHTQVKKGACYTSIKKTIDTNSSTKLTFLNNKQNVATASYRLKSFYCLLENFSVEQNKRNQGIGSALFPIVMQEIAGDSPAVSKVHWIVYPTDVPLKEKHSMQERLNNFYKRQKAEVNTQESTAWYDLKQIKA